MVTSDKSSGSRDHAKRILQSRLNSLLTSLADTTKVIKKWPSSDGDNGKIHIDTTTTLIESLQKVITALKRVEDSFNDNKEQQIIELRKRLQECQIPVDLLDLMDYGGLSDTGFGLNPECFIQGLLREALRQLAGLRRRKNALTMLGAAIKSGIEKRDTLKEAADSNNDEGIASRKRPRDVSDEDDDGNSRKKQA